MNLSSPTKADVCRIAAVAAFAAYFGVTASLYQNETRMHATGKALARRHRAIESELLGVSSSLDRLQRAGNPPPARA
jgi:hypothetical protein